MRRAAGVRATAILAVAVGAGLAVLAIILVISSSDRSGAVEVITSDRPAMTIAGQRFGAPDRPVFAGVPLRLVNLDATPHRIRTDDPGGTTLELGPSTSSAITLTRVGPVRFRCDLHPAMSASVSVLAPLAPTVPQGPQPAAMPAATALAGVPLPDAGAPIGDGATSTTGTVTTPSTAPSPAAPTPSALTPTASAAPSTVRATPGSSRWTVLFGGDVLLTRRVSPTTNPFGRIRPSLASADLAIVNVETAISVNGRAAAKQYTFRSPPSFATLMAQAGVDVVSLANNHTLDFGPQALADTVRHLRDAGIQPTGAGTDLTRALAPASIAVGGQRVAVLGGSQIIPNGGWLATANRAGIVSGGKHVIDARTDTLLSAVRRARATHDVVLVVMHWGIEGDPCPSAVQRRLGKLLRDAGATAVLGAHPHVLQPIVADRDASGGLGLVAYSLGNFIWDPRSGATADTGVLEVVFDGPAMVGHRFVPHRLDANGWAAAVDPASDAGTRITARTTRRCSR